MSVRKKLLQKMVIDRSPVGKGSLIEKVSQGRTMENYLLASRFVEENQKVLDIGAGYGLGYDYILEKNPGEIICIDPFKGAKENFLHKDRRIRFVVNDFMDNDFKNESFDIVLCIGVLYFFSDHDRFFEEVSRVLKPGGVAIVNCFCRDLISLYFGVGLNEIASRYSRIYNDNELSALLKDHFGEKPEVYIQSPVVIKPRFRFFFSALSMPLTLPFARPHLIKKSADRSGIYNYFVVKKNGNGLKIPQS